MQFFKIYYQLLSNQPYYLGKKRIVITVNMLEKWTFWANKEIEPGVPATGLTSITRSTTGTEDFGWLVSEVTCCGSREIWAPALQPMSCVSTWGCCVSCKMWINVSISWRHRWSSINVGSLPPASQRQRKSLWGKWTNMSGYSKQLIMENGEGQEFSGSSLKQSGSLWRFWCRLDSALQIA